MMFLMCHPTYTVQGKIQGCQNFLFWAVAPSQDSASGEVKKCKEMRRPYPSS